MAFLANTYRQNLYSQLWYIPQLLTLSKAAAHTQSLYFNRSTLVMVQDFNKLSNSYFQISR